MWKKYRHLSVYLLVPVLAVIYWQVQNWRNPSFIAEHEVQCDVLAGCELALDGLDISWRFDSQGPIKALSSVPLTVSWQGELDSIVADLTGLNEDMGLLRTKLEISEQQAEAAVFIPTCVQQSMQWRLTLMLQTDQGLLAVHSYFQSEQ